MKLLAVDTCGPQIGVALLVGEDVRFCVERATRGAEALLVPWAQRLAAEAGIELSELDGVVVARGPGAFTGLRVGLAMGLGIATAVGCPVASISSLRSRAGRSDRLTLSLLDARKGRVYAQLFLNGQPTGDPVDQSPEGVIEGLAEGFLATGEGAIVYRELIERAGGEVAADATSCAVDHLARRGAEALIRGEGLPPTEVRPVYLRAPDAIPPKKR